MPIVKSDIGHVLNLDLTSLHVIYCKGLYKTKLVDANYSREQLDSELFEKIKGYCNSHGLDHRQPGFIHVQPEYTDIYKYFFAISLVYYPIHNIRAYLDHQLEKVDTDKKEFVEYIKHSIVPLTEANSHFDNTRRLITVMTWAEDKVNKINSRRDNIITSTELPVSWPSDKSQLRNLSESLFESKYLSSRLAFESVFTDNKRIEWKGEVKYLIYLLYCLRQKHKFKVKHGKGHMKAAIRHFLPENSEILAKENKIHHLLSDIRHKNDKTHASIRKKVHDLFISVFNTDPAKEEISEDSQ